MDICRWLQETSEPNIQALSPARGLEYEIRHQPAVAHSNRRDRFSAGSPLEIAFPERNAHHNHQKRARTPSSKCDSSPAYSSSSGSASDSTTSSSGQRAYRKRPRHRTKADKYESKVKTKEHGQRRKRDGKREHPGRSKRKSRKKYNDAHATGIVQSFHARNVPKERLTLNPKNSGLYTQGRASGPVKGQGLPDLVFSEMRFLQKVDATGENLGRIVTETREKGKKERTKERKKDRKHIEEQEMPAYFGITRKEGGIQMHGDQAQAGLEHARCSLLPVHSTDASQHLSAVPDFVRPTVELPDRPFLGFGSRGRHHRSTSYLTWSESLRERSPPRLNNPQLEPIKIGGFQTMQSGQIPHGAKAMDIATGSRVDDGECAGQSQAVVRDCARTAYAAPLTAEQRLEGKLEAPKPLTNTTSAGKLHSATALPDYDVTLLVVKRVPSDRNSTKSDDLIEFDNADMTIRKEAEQHDERAYVEISAVGGDQVSSSSPLKTLLRRCSAAAKLKTAGSNQESYHNQERSESFQEHDSRRNDMSIAVDTVVAHGNRHDRISDLIAPQLAPEEIRMRHGQSFTGDACFDDTLYREAEIWPSDWGLQEPSQYETGDNWESVPTESETDRQEVVVIQEGTGHQDGTIYAEGEDVDELAGFWRPNRLY